MQKKDFNRNWTFYLEGHEKEGIIVLLLHDAMIYEKRSGENTEKTMGLDSRSRYSKMVIRNSIFALLQEKLFHCISVTEVCKRAEINRTAFYKYYRDMPDWKEQIEQLIFGPCQFWLSFTRKSRAFLHFSLS